MSIEKVNFNFFNRRKVEVVQQSEASECGLACLAMCVNYWGGNTDLRALRNRFAVSTRGISVKGLSDTARILQFHTRVLRVGLSEVPKLSLPCILHWEGMHFVVLKKLKKGVYFINDPKHGEVECDEATFSNKFTGITIELLPNEQFVPLNDKKALTWSDIYLRTAGVNKSVFLMLGLGIVLQAFTLMSPLFLQWITDEAVASTDTSLLTTLGISFLLLAVLQVLISSLRSWVITITSQKFSYQWTRIVLLKLLRLPVVYFEKRSLGHILSRFGSLGAIERSMTTETVESVIDATLLATTLIAILVYAPTLALISIASVASYAVMRALHFRKIRQSTLEQIDSSARQNAYMVESFRGFQSLKLAGKLADRGETWSALLARETNSNLNLSRISLGYSSFTGLLRGAENVIILWIGALLVMRSSMTIGMLVAYLSYKSSFVDKAMAVTDRVLGFRLLSTHLERIAEILLSEDDSFELLEQSAETPKSFDVELRNISYKYSPHEPFVLKNINLKIDSGDFVAITGESGSGKSTLLKILLGLVSPTEGEVLIGGVPLTALGGSVYRSLCGTVMQDDYVFSGTISENISLSEVIDSPQIRQAAEWANISDEIMRLPAAYQTILGEQGSGLSGGQRQRVLLARALYRQPRLLFLDEATSHLDAENEAKVNAAIERLSITRISVAHRAETIRAARRVVRLHKGELASDVLI